jgi:hypothetical protein
LAAVEGLQLRRRRRSPRRQAGHDIGAKLALRLPEGLGSSGERAEVLTVGLYGVCVVEWW